LVVGGVAGLIVGCLVGWLAIGWWLWPVEYVGDAYTYELNDSEKMEYVAAVADSYNLTRQVEAARKRFNAWTPEEKIEALARLFVEDQVQGKMQEAERAADLAVALQGIEGWDPAVVAQVANRLATQYTQEGVADKAQYVALFARELGVSETAPPPAMVSTPTTAGPETRIPLVGSLGTLSPLLCVPFLVVLFILLLFILARRRAARRRAAEAKPRWTGAGPPPLLQKTSNYTLGMDNFDESFAIETPDGEWLGECGMGISESLGEETPRRVAAFEVWLFDKRNTLTVTKVLMSDFAYNDEKLLNKLSVRGEPILATPGVTFTLETPSLTVKAQVVEMEYGDGRPAFGYFNNLSVSLTVFPKPEAGGGSDASVPPGMGVSG